MSNYKDIEKLTNKRLLSTYSVIGIGRDED
jgi:hypothetical protein